MGLGRGGIGFLFLSRDQPGKTLALGQEEEALRVAALFSWVGLGQDAVGRGRMDYAGLSFLLHLRTDLQKSDLHGFDLQRFPSFLSQPRCPTPASNPVILWQDRGRKS